MLTPEVEPITYRLLRKRCLSTPDVFVHEIGGTATHIHLAVTVPPTISISEWIGQLKGGSAHDVNEEMNKRQKVIQWQTGYGVVRFGTNDTDWVKRYIRNQRQHHARRTVHDRLERIMRTTER